MIFKFDSYTERETQLDARRLGGPAFGVFWSDREGVDSFRRVFFFLWDPQSSQSRPIHPPYGQLRKSRHIFRPNTFM